VDQILKGTGKEVFFVPGEHDVLNDDGAQFRERYAKSAKGAGWYSFTRGRALHRAGEVMNRRPAGWGRWVTSSWSGWKDDVKHLKHSTPIVVFGTFRCGAFYPEWGWGRTTVRRRWHI